MRLTAVPLAAAILLGTTACSREPESSAATANADVLADQLQAKANNYSMMADDTVNAEAADALENASASLSDRSANLRAGADPDEGVK